SSVRPGCTAAFSVEVGGQERLVVVAELDSRNCIDTSVVIDTIQQKVAEVHQLQLYAVLLVKSGSIPKTSSGKIQRHACRAGFIAGDLGTVESRIVEQSYEVLTEEVLTASDLLSLDPAVRKTKLEDYLRIQFASVLKRSTAQLGREQSLNGLGLDSLTMVEIKNRLESDLALSLPVSILFQDITIQQLATQLLEQIESNAEFVPVLHTSRTVADYTLSYGQQALWFLHQLAPQSPAYNIFFAVHILSEVNVEALQETFQLLLDRHSSLRTVYRYVENSIRQHINDQQEIDFKVIAASEWDSAKLNQKLVEEAHHPFDLSNGPLLRVRLFTSSAYENTLLLTFHHIAVDLWSLVIFIDELRILYSAYQQGRASIPLFTTGRYHDFIRWQFNMLSGPQGERLWNFWQQQLCGELPVLDLPIDRPRQIIRTDAGATCHFKLNKELTQQLKSLAQSEGVTINMLLMAAFQTQLHRYSKQEDIIVGMPASGRNRAEFENTVGYFVNPLALRGNLWGSPSFKTFLARIRTSILAALEHQDYPFPLLVERLQPKRDVNRSPIFDVMFILQKPHQSAELAPFVLNYSGARANLAGMEIESIIIKEHSAQFDLTLMMVEHDDVLLGCWQYNTDLFENITIKRMSSHFETLLTGIVTDPKEQLSMLPLLTAIERNQLLVEWNSTNTDFQPDKCIHQLFEEQVERSPQAVAVRFKNTELTYWELNCRANQLAHYLRWLGVGPEVLVGVLTERCLEMVIALLAITKAGGGYVPLETSYPKERLAYLLEDAKVSILLTEHDLITDLVTDNLTEVCLKRDWPIINEQRQDNPIKLVQGNNLAYLIYTSGSTGKPKGVAIEHRSSVAMLEWAREVYSSTELAAVLVSTSLCFDLSVYEIFAPLSMGGKLIIVENVLALTELEQASEVSLINTVPSAMAELVRLKAIPESVTVVNLAGEALSASLVERLYEQESIQSVYNLYGPSEDTTYSTYARLERGSNKIVPIGRPISNTQVYILDKKLQPVAVGVAGELCLSGAGLARGYFNRPELTAEKFIANPYSSAAGARLYCTGDLARYLPDGKIEYLGRIDHQVKIRGFRIELAEIEVVLAQHTTVAECIVVAREDSTDEKRLVAYLVAQQGTIINTSDIRSHLKERLPEYMLPSAYVVLDKMPVTHNGKIDRNALPAPYQATVSKAYIGARTPVEEMLIGFYEELLGLKGVSIYDNFFELGGHSLLATQLISRVRKVFEIDFPLRNLSEAPILATLAERIEKARTTAQDLNLSPILPVSRDVAIPVSFAQQRLWFLEQLRPGSVFYNLSTAIHIRGQLNVIALERSLQEIIHRHEILRTAFVNQDGQPYQIIATSTTQRIPIIDLRELSLIDRDSEAQRLTSEDARQPFDLECGPLLRSSLVWLAKNEYLCILSMHHIVCDDWSIGIFIREMTLLYEAYSQAKPSPLAKLPLQYADFAHWQRSWLPTSLLPQQLAYWLQQLADIPELKLPTDRPRQGENVFRGKHQSLGVPKNLYVELRKLSQQTETTLFMTLLAAFGTLLYRYTGQDDIVIGAPIANRNKTEVEGLIGVFINQLVMRIDLSGNPTFRELLRRVRKMTLEAYDNQDLPFDELVAALQPKRTLNYLPLIQVQFDLHNTPTQSIELPNLTLTPIEIERGAVQFDLVILLSEMAETLRGTVGYNTDLFNDKTIAQLIDDYKTVLEQVVTNPDARLIDIPLRELESPSQYTYAGVDDEAYNFNF
ncbi:MAG: amino acid adenylation domain-containing protein, partial [Acidobacteriota bacterium]